MKVLFCDNSLKELLNFRGDIISHFRSKGDEVLLLAPENISLDSLPEGCRFCPTHVDRGGMNPLHDCRLFWKLLRTYSSEKPDIVFHYTIKPNIYGSLACKLLRIPSVAVVTGLGYAFNHNDLRSRIARVLYRLGLRCSRYVIVLNSECRDVLVANRIVVPEKLVLFTGGEGINLDRYQIL